MKKKGTEMASGRRQRIGQKVVDLRSRLWPNLNEDRLWHRKKSTGFTTIPRTMQLFLRIMDDLSKNTPVSSTYFDLWCRMFDESFVVLAKPREMAFHAGFTGQRAERTWRERLKILQGLHFIDLKPGPTGDYSYALIFNPYHVIKDHFFNQTPGLTEGTFNTLIERAVEIGATDFDSDTPPEFVVPKSEPEEENIPF